MSRFKPHMSYMTRESLREYLNSGYWVKNKSKYITKQYNTYRELKKDLKDACEQNIDDEGVHVLRSKRAEWGEYFEYWKLDNNDKPTIVKEGWN